VVDDDGRVIRPSLVVGGGAVDRVVGDGRREARRGQVVVDAPTRVVVEGLAALGPPAIRALNLTGPLAADVDPAEARAVVVVLVALGADDLIEVGALGGKEPGVLDVALPVLDV